MFYYIFLTIHLKKMTFSKNPQLNESAGEKKKKKKQRAACSINSEVWVMELKLKPEVSQNPPEHNLRFSQLN